MKKVLLISFICSFQSVFAQERSLQFKDYFNEFHIAVNHGIPMSANKRSFFGGGLGISHVFRADKLVGARGGLELEFFHILGPDTYPPESADTRKNQHFYLTSLTIPLNIRFSFGKRTRFLFEFGGRGGFIVLGHYTADVLKTNPNQESYFEHTKTNKAPLGLGTVGLNSGFGVSVPLNEKLDLLVRPDVGANLYFMDQSKVQLYGRLCVGIHLK